MLTKIQEVHKALDYGCYHCALALALTFPDICSKVINKKGGEGYAEWYDMYALKYFSFPNYEKDGIITGKECYRLRCAYLHQGNFDLKYSDKTIQCDKFILHTSEKSEKEGFHNLVKTINENTLIDVDVNLLCLALCNATYDFYNQIDDKSKFHDELIQDAE